MNEHLKTSINLNKPKALRYVVKLFFLIALLPGYQLFAQHVEVEGDIDLKNNQIKNVTDPTDLQDATTKKYVDQVLVSFALTFGHDEGLQRLLDAGYCPLELIEVGVDKDSLYGKFYQGGLIFYLDDQDTIPGIKGLVSAPDDQKIKIDSIYYTSTSWGCSWIDVPNVPNVPYFPPVGKGAEIGDGQNNTVNIVLNACIEDHDAAKVCDELNLNGYNDWFLPSYKELYEMYITIGPAAPGANQNIGNLIGTYWSSSENNSSDAWTTHGSSFKFNAFKVRAARIF